MCWDMEMTTNYKAIEAEGQGVLVEGMLTCRVAGVWGALATASCELESKVKFVFVFALSPDLNHMCHAASPEFC